jgi:hypothetical protein
MAAKSVWIGHQIWVSAQEETSGKTMGTSTITDKDSRRDGTHTTIARRSDSI